MCRMFATDFDEKLKIIAHYAKKCVDMGDRV
jgi:hypothetical protein|nr:MAG TPA: hypothetical protein [Caudoviricetes sp.]